MREVRLGHLNLEGWQHPRCGVFTQRQEGRPSHPAGGKAGVPSPLRQKCVLGIQSCLILCDPMNCSPPGSFVHGVSPGKNTGVVGIPISRGSSRPRDGTWVSCIAGRFFTV